MPGWPFFMGFTAILTVWGWTMGAGMWRVPAAVLAGYVATRFVMWTFDHPATLFALFLVWASVAGYLAHREAWIPCIAFLLSGSVYPVGFLLGLRIEYLGLLPLSADILAVLALIIMTGGMHVRSSNFDTADDRGRRDLLADLAVGMAQSEGAPRAHSRKAN